MSNTLKLFFLIIILEICVSLLFYLIYCVHQSKFHPLSCPYYNFKSYKSLPQHAKLVYERRGRTRSREIRTQ